MNWQQRIDRAAERGSFDDADLDLAANWVTCACGEQDPRIPRKCGAPEDLELRLLGSDFSRAVQSDSFFEASKLLGLIERRAAELLK